MVVGGGGPWSLLLRTTVATMGVSGVMVDGVLLDNPPCRRCRLLLLGG